MPDELPRIRAPATRALAGIGVTRLSQLAEHRAADLRKLHGMGPRAIAILRQALIGSCRSETTPELPWQGEALCPTPPLAFPTLASPPS